MKFFLDTEFIEGFKRPIKWLPTIGNWNKPYHSIQLISISLVCEDGRQYYAISNEFDPDAANDWVKKNVLKPESLQWEFTTGFKATLHPYGLPLKEAMFEYGKSNKQIALEICRFIDERYIDTLYPDHGCFSPVQSNYPKEVGTTDLAFYADFADYDWVLFCSLFGTMADLPKGFPMYCHDLRQMLEEKAELVARTKPTKFDSALKWDSAKTKIAQWQSTDAYPKQTDEHNALSDAQWNFELYKFLQGDLY